MPSADKQISFKMTSSLAEELSKLSYKMDVNMSKMVRGCLLLGMPVFEKNPMLLDVIDTINSYRKYRSSDDEI